MERKLQAFCLGSAVGFAVGFAVGVIFFFFFVLVFLAFLLPLRPRSGPAANSSAAAGRLEMPPSGKAWRDLTVRPIMARKKVVSCIVCLWWLTDLTNWIAGYALYAEHKITCKHEISRSREHDSRGKSIL